MRNARLEEAQAGIKIAGRNIISHLRYTDDTTLMAESEEELKSFLMKVKVEWRSQDGGGVGRGEHFLPHKFIKRLLSSSLLSAIRVGPIAYLRLLIFLPAILIPACASSSLAFLMM